MTVKRILSGLWDIVESISFSLLVMLHVVVIRAFIQKVKYGYAALVGAALICLCLYKGLGTEVQKTGSRREGS